MPPAPPEYRRDPVSGRWVIIAPERAVRPMALRHARPHHRHDLGGEHCPFCEGREDRTTGEVYAVRRPGTAADRPGWQLRVVPNMYPAVRPLPDADPAGRGRLLESFPGFGHHEVVIECPHHESDPARLTDGQFAAVLVAYRERLAALARDPRVAYVSAFKNVGAEAGASLPHAHSQLVATPIVPDAVRRELEGASDYYRREGRCVFCDLLSEERAAGLRIVRETEHFVALCPFASRFGYEVWVLPSEHASRYEELSDDLAAELARLMRDVLARLDGVLESAAYNYYLHTAPVRSSPLPYYHWHLEILPHTSRPAGFEWGSDCFINAVPPEQAAAALRDA